MMKLAGIRVVDFSPTVPGATLARLMADHGAQVTKIEPPDGSPLRRDTGNPDLLAFCDRGKQVLAMDLKDPDDRERARDIAAGSDVLVESNRPGAMERLGLGYEVLAARNPRLVYASLSSYGQEGPLSGLPGHDLSIRAMAGALLTPGNQAPPPMTMDIALAGAYLGLGGVLMALHAAARTGRGDRLDLSLHDVALTLQSHRLGEATAQPPEPPTPMHPFLDSYRTRDDRWLCLAGREPAFVRTLLTDLGLAHLIGLAGQPQAQETLRQALAERFMCRTLAEWVQWFERRDVAYAPALHYHEALAHPQVAARGMQLEDAQGRVHLNTPLRFLHEPARPTLRVEQPQREREPAA